MALIKCSDCGKEVSSNAASCPNCGNPISFVTVPQYVLHLSRSSLMGNKLTVHGLINGVHSIIITNGERQTIEISEGYNKIEFTAVGPMGIKYKPTVYEIEVHDNCSIDLSVAFSGRVNADVRGAKVLSGQ